MTRCSIDLKRMYPRPLVTKYQSCHRHIVLVQDVFDFNSLVADPSGETQWQYELEPSVILVLRMYCTHPFNVDDHGRTKRSV